MTIREISKLIDAEVVCCEDCLDQEVTHAFGSDMMSDVLAYAKDRSILLTGLLNPQVIRTAMMMDMPCIVFVRGKVPTPDMITLAEQHSIVMMHTKNIMYRSCGILYSNGLDTGLN